MAPEDLRPGTRLCGLSEGVVVLVHAEPLGAGALNLVYRCADGTLGEQVLTENDLARLESASATTWSFDADADDLTLALEATRMRLAGLVDPMLAVTTSRVDPLPHQLRAAYGEMLPRPGALAEMQQGAIAPVDLAQATIGPGMAVFSSYSRVLDADGTP